MDTTIVDSPIHDISQRRLHIFHKTNEKILEFLICENRQLDKALMN